MFPAMGTDCGYMMLFANVHIPGNTARSSPVDGRLIITLFSKRVRKLVSVPLHPIALLSAEITNVLKLMVAVLSP